jgi:glutamyl-tRNA synthetase
MTFCFAGMTIGSWFAIVFALLNFFDMIRVRIAPSPTGLLHIGTVRTALYNFLFARREKGVMVTRIEDTDSVRSTKEFEDDIVHGLTRLGIAGDEGVHAGGKFGPYRQSERREVYTKYLRQLLDADKVYFCFCGKERLEQLHKDQMSAKLPPRYDGACAGLDPAENRRRVEAGEAATIRLRVPKDEDLKFTDLIRGENVVHSRELDDMIIARRPDDPLYNFTVVCDDHDMQISHVIRGEDHIPNTPKQILIYRAFGWDVPAFAHLPLILNADKSKLSKRKNKVSFDDFMKEGYLPEAMINFLALLGWHPGGEGKEAEREVYSLDELAEKFTLDRVHKGGAVFDQVKLDHINGEYIKKYIADDVDGFYNNILLSFLRRQESKDNLTEEMDSRLRGNDKLVKKLLRDPDFEGRFKKLSEIRTELGGFFGEVPAYDASLILNAKFKITPETATTVFEHAIALLQTMDWERGDGAKTKVISDNLIGLVDNLGLKNGQVLWPIRAALSGGERSPNFATLAVYLGKDESLKRLRLALEKIK